MPLTLSKLGVHDCGGGTLEKWVILVRKANWTRECRGGRSRVTFLLVLVPLAGLHPGALRMVLGEGRW